MNPTTNSDPSSLETMPAPSPKRRHCAHCGRRTTKRCAVPTTKFVGRKMRELKVGDHVIFPRHSFQKEIEARDAGRVVALAAVDDKLDFWCQAYCGCPAAEAIQATIERRDPNHKGALRRIRVRFNPETLVAVRSWRICRKPCCSRCRMAPGPEKFVCCDHWPGRV